MPQEQPSPFTESKDNMATTYEKIASTTLGSANATISFTSISSAYTDLRVSFTMNGQSVASGVPILQFNSDTGTNYSLTRLAGQGTVAASTRDSSASSISLASYTAPQTSTPTFITLDIFSYAGSTFKTNLITFNNDYNGSGSVEYAVGLWRSTSAITSIQLKAAGSNTFNTGTIATLYGIKAA